MRAAMFVLVAGLALPSADAWADEPPQGWQFIGRTEAAAAVEVQPRVTGYLTRVAVKEGDTVAKGDVLIEIDPRPYQLALEAAQARLKVAEAQVKAARIQTGQSKKLMDKNFVSSFDLNLKAAAAEEAEAALAVAKVEVEQAELTLSWTRITAPFDGRVSRLRATQGGLVVADQTHALTVVSTDPPRVSFSVPASRLLQLRRDGLADPEKLNVAVGFFDEEGFPHAAKLDLIEPEANLRTGTVEFRATVPDPKGLLSPGMAAQVRLSPAPQ